MKVLQINSFFSVGGPPRIMNGIYDTLKEKGFDCKIAASREKMYAPQDSYQVCDNYKVRVYALKARILDNEGFNATRETKRLVDYIKEYNPDVIHLHNLHDCWTLTGHCAHFAIIGCEKWKTGCYSCPQSREYPASIISDRSRQNYSMKRVTFSGVKNMTIVTPSNWLASYIPDSILKEYPVKVIHNGIDLKVFSRTKSDVLKRNGLESKKIVLGVAQNWSEKKGLEDFVELSKRLSNSYKVVLIGVTNEQKKVLPVSMYGVTRTESIQELIEWYSAAQVFVNLTYQDTFPTVNIEALACGTPVITYRTGGSPEAVDESCGWVVEQGDIQRVVDLIYNMRPNDFYKEAAIKRSKRFGRQERYNEYCELYREICVDIHE